MKKILIAGNPEKVTNYEDAVTRLGAFPKISLDPTDTASFDALLLPGGGDVEPSLYGETNQGSNGIDLELDRQQMKLLELFIQAKKPVLAICRGLQLVNVYFGGTLIQDLPTAAVHRHIGHDQAHPSHAVPGSILAELYGCDFPINSAHHQGIRDLGAGLSVIQFSHDGVIEAVIHDTLPILALQWHPERMCFAHRREDTVDGSLILAHFLDSVPEQ